MDETRFYRDASDRLCFWIVMPSMTEFPKLADEIANSLGLVADGRLIADGVSIIFRTCRRDSQTIELAWDHWGEFTVTAKSAESESLVREIAGTIHSMADRPTKRRGPLGWLSAAWRADAGMVVIGAVLFSLFCLGLAFVIWMAASVENS